MSVSGDVEIRRIGVTPVSFDVLRAASIISVARSFHSHGVFAGVSRRRPLL
jgi:hypothetical protein